MPEWNPYIRKRLASIRLDSLRENEIVDELAAHLEDRYREMLARGASHREADLAARAELSDGQLLNLVIRTSGEPASQAPGGKERARVD